MPKKNTVPQTQITTVPQRRFLLTLLMSLLIIFGILTVVIAIVGFKIKSYVQAFTSSSHTSVQELVEIGRAGWQTQPKMDEGKVNILLLGTDELVNRAGDPILTDTIMLLSMDTQSGKLSAVSMPRDLWLPEYQTKINALYWYGKDHNPEHPELFTQQIIQETTQVPIHYTIVVSLETVAEIIDALGGLDMYVFNGFIDEFFPREDVDIRTERDPKRLYKTVEFTQGLEKMTGERALQYMRSRKSQNLEVGTDDARSIRQQQVIGALMERLKDKSLIEQPETLGRLFYIYKTDVNAYFPITDAIGLGKLIREDVDSLEFSPSTISIQSPTSTGVLFHPAVDKYDQWVYEILSIEQFREEVKEKMGY